MIVYLVVELALDLRRIVRRHRARPPATWGYHYVQRIAGPTPPSNVEFDFHLEPHDATSREVLATRPAGVIR